MPDGRVGHAEVKVGGAIIMLADEFPEWEQPKPAECAAGVPPRSSIYVKDVDAFVAHAEKAGAKVLMAPETMFYGDRSSKSRRPFRSLLDVFLRVEDLTPEEINERAKTAFTEGGCGDGDKS